MSIDRRPNGKYRARWREYPSGPQKTKQFDRKRDAEEYLAEVTVALSKGTYLTVEARSITVSQYIEKYYARRVWKARTKMAAENALDRCVDVLGADRPLSTIRRGDVESLIVRLSTDLAASTTKVTYQHLRSVLRSAHIDGLIAADITLGVKLPEAPHRSLVVPDPDTVRALLSAAPLGFKGAVALGAFCGLRQGEASGLRVHDVDYLRRVVHVRQQLVTKPTVALTDPKTRSSVRDVPVPAFVTDLLAEHVSACGEGPHGLLLHQWHAPLDSSRFGVLWRRCQRLAGLPEGGLRFHWLRHAFASALIHGGCSVVEVAGALGHSNPGVTLSTYAHLWPKPDDRIREATAIVWSDAGADAASAAGPADANDVVDVVDVGEVGTA